MKKRKAPIKPVKKENVESSNTEMCVGCQSLTAPVDLNDDTQAEILFASRWADSNFACVSCAFHGSLISQLRNALLGDQRRVAASCLVCQSSDSILLEMQQVEGAHQALSHPVLEVKSSIIKIATPSRKVCNSCAYSLQWLYKQSLKIYVKATKSHSSARNIKEKEEEDEEEDKETVANSRHKRMAATKIKTEPSSPPVRPARRTSVSVTNTKVSNGKPPASRTSKKIYTNDSDTEDSVDEEPVKKKTSRSVSIKSESKTKTSNVVSETRPSRKVVAPDRFQITTETVASKESRDSKPKPRRVLIRDNVESSNKTGLKRKVPERLLRQVKRQATNELMEYECDECSQVFYSGVSAGLHKLEHEGRYFTLELERCATPVYNNSSSSSEELEDEVSSSGESKRKPRKPEKPVKNAARDRLNNEANADSNFVFVAPLRVSCPKSVQSSTSDKEPINFGFEKPTVVSTEEKENEFSDDDEEEESGTGNVDSCISSLENSENQNKSSDEEINKVPVIMENVGKTVDNNEVSESENNVSKNESENEPSVSTSINQALSLDFEAPQEVSNTNDESSNKTAEEASVTKSNCLKFDFDEPAIPIAKSIPPKTISSALCFDYDPPVNDVSTKKSPDKNSPVKIMAPLSKSDNEKNNDSGSSTYFSTENDYPSESGNGDHSSAVDSTISETFMNVEDGFQATVNPANMLANNIDTSHALRDDSSNPTLPQSQQDSSFAFHSNEQNVTDLVSLEKMVSQV